MDFRERISNFCNFYKCDFSMEPTQFSTELEYKDVNLTLPFGSLMDLVYDSETKITEQHYLKNNHSVKAAYDQYQLVLQLAKNDG